MPAIALSALTNLLKIQYPGGLEEAMAIQSPLLARIPKMPFKGSAISTKIKHSPGQKASSTFATIQAASAANGGFGASAVSEFLNSAHFNNYAVFQLETAAISRSEGNAAGVRSYVKSETDSALEDLAGQLTTALYGNGSGLLAVSGGISTTALTLANPEDAIKFEVNQVVVGSATLDGSGAATQPTVITRIDRENGILYAAANWNAIFTTGNGIYRVGNYGNQAAGLGAWVPDHSVVDLSVAFRNVVRNVDIQRLAGNNYVTSGSDGTYMRALSRALSHTQRAVKGARPDELYVNGFVFDRICEELNDRFEWVINPGRSMEGSAVSVNYGVKGIKVTIGDAEATIYKDLWCPRDEGWLLQIDTWDALVVPGGFPRTLEGGDGLTVSDADASEFRFAAYWDTRCKNPGKNCRIDMSYLNGL